MADSVTPEWAKRIARDSWPLDEPTDLIAAVRAGVESGTIKEEVVWWCQGTRVTDDGAVAGVLPGSLAWQNCFEGRITRHKDCGWRLVVSDGGSET